MRNICQSYHTVDFFMYLHSIHYKLKYKPLKKKNYWKIEIQCGKLCRYLYNKCNSWTIGCFNSFSIECNWFCLYVAIFTPHGVGFNSNKHFNKNTSDIQPRIINKYFQRFVVDFQYFKSFVRLMCARLCINFCLNLCNSLLFDDFEVSYDFVNKVTFAYIKSPWSHEPFDGFFSCVFNSN